MPAKLQLASTWNRDPLPATDQPSLAYLVIDISGIGDRGTGIGDQVPSPTRDPDPHTRTRVPAIPDPHRLNLSLVLDTSGSMAGAKLQNLKQAVRWVIDHLDP